MPYRTMGRHRRGSAHTYIQQKKSFDLANKQPLLVFIAGTYDQEFPPRKPNGMRPLVFHFSLPLLVNSARALFRAAMQKRCVSEVRLPSFNAIAGPSKNRKVAQASRCLGLFSQTKAGGYLNSLPSSRGFPKCPSWAPGIAAAAKGPLRLLATQWLSGWKPTGEKPGAGLSTQTAHRRTAPAS